MISACIVFGTLCALIIGETQAPISNIHIRGFELQTIVGFVTPKIVDWMKNSKAKPLRFIHPGDPESVRWVSAVFAALTTLGVGVSFSGDFWSSGGGTVTLAHISIPMVVNAAVTFASAWIYQWTIHHSSWEFFWKSLAWDGTEHREPQT